MIRGDKGKGGYMPSLHSPGRNLKSVENVKGMYGKVKVYRRRAQKANPVYFGDFAKKTVIQAKSQPALKLDLEKVTESDPKTVWPRHEL